MPSRSNFPDWVLKFRYNFCPPLTHRNSFSVWNISPKFAEGLFWMKMKFCRCSVQYLQQSIKTGGRPLMVITLAESFSQFISIRRRCLFPSIRWCRIDRKRLIMCCVGVFALANLKYPYTERQVQFIYLTVQRRQHIDSPRDSKNRRFSNMHLKFTLLVSIGILTLVTVESVVAWHLLMLRRAALHQRNWVTLLTKSNRQPIHNPASPMKSPRWKDNLQLRVGPFRHLLAIFIMHTTKYEPIISFRWYE